MASFLSRLLGVPRIEKPSLGVLDLSGGTASQVVHDDRSQLAPLFAAVVESLARPPKCDVLFVYCHLAESGAVSGSELGLREIIRDSGAKVVVLALPNEPAACIAASKQNRYGAANLVMTLDRKDAAFGRFFSRLFTAMKKGTSMPLAWVKLAPQGLDHPDCPDTIFACEVGQLAFS
jgi:hypothetical protein